MSVPDGPPRVFGLPLKARTRRTLPLEFAVNPSSVSPRLLGPMARLTAAVLDVTGPENVRDTFRRAGEGGLAEDQVDALGAELDMLAGLLAIPTGR